MMISEPTLAGVTGCRIGLRSIRVLTVRFAIAAETAPAGTVSQVITMDRTICGAIEDRITTMVDCVNVTELIAGRLFNSGEVK